MDEGHKLPSDSRLLKAQRQVQRERARKPYARTVCCSSHWRVLQGERLRKLNLSSAVFTRCQGLLNRVKDLLSPSWFLDLLKTNNENVERYSQVGEAVPLDGEPSNGENGDSEQVRLTENTSGRWPRRCFHRSIHQNTGA